MRRALTITLLVLCTFLTANIRPALSSRTPGQQTPRRPINDSDDPPLPAGSRDPVQEDLPGTDFVYPRGVRPSPGDVDADGIPDAEEQRILDKFAPTFKHDARETHFPAVIEDYLPQVALVFRHKGCADHAVLGMGQVNPRSLLRQVHPVGCSHQGGSLASNAPLKGEEFFYMSLATCTRWTTECQRQARDECAGSNDPQCQANAMIECQREFRRRERELIRRGETNDPLLMCEDVGILRGFADLNRIRAYAAVRPSGSVRNGYNIYVKVFYPVSAQTGGFLFNFVCCFGEHAADWEGVSMQVTREGELVGVTYNAHGKKTWVPAAQVPRDADGVRPLVFVAAQSHAMYFKAGEDGRGPLKPTDYHNGNGFQFTTRGHILNVGRVGFPFPGFEWTEYRGPWGQDWDPASLPILGDIEGASPKTPNF